MADQKQTNNTYHRREIKGYDALEELALDLFWSWNHSTDKVWQTLDPDQWDLTHNPWTVLQTVSREKLERMLADKDFGSLIENLIKTKKTEEESLTWFQEAHPKAPLTCAAYFSMEYMLCEALPIYSGGLGNVAGDQLKSASDLGIPVVAVGLLYQQGYFRQLIDKDGMQQALYPYNDPGQLPITPLRKANGEWLRVEIVLPGWSLWLRCWQAQVGRLKLYLLDTNDAANFPAHRGITSELYGGNADLRIKQEIVLGIGGWRMLEEIGIEPEICHLNEGHAAFAVLERARSFMKKTGQPFNIALAATRAGNLFTTHTAVPAGFDQFSPSLIEQYLGNYAQNKLNIKLNDLLALGRQNPHDPLENFNMAYLALHGSGAVNGVSCLHGKVSRNIFQPLFPRWPEDEVPIGYITNGVHMPSWDSASSDSLWEEACGKCRWLGTTEKLEKEIYCLSDEKIWQMRSGGRSALITFARSRLARFLDARGVSMEEVKAAKNLFDPNILTLGFARRFATYKRPNLLLHDPQRLLRILTNVQRPVQLILAGKAHPADLPGQSLIQDWMHFIKRPDARAHVMFLSDYDMHLTEQLVQGVDIWINTPRRPWEACGTSGMKVLVNGGINISELDGWWAEAFIPEVGWALGDGNEHNGDPAWDASEADKLYTLLENEVIPEFYARNEKGLPTAWIKRIRESMARLTPRYSANRAVREYTEKHYLPGAKAYLKRAANIGELAVQITDWKKRVKEIWPQLKFVDAKVDAAENTYMFEIHINLSTLDPKDVKVELFANGINPNLPTKHEMVIQPSEDPSVYVYRITVSASRPLLDYTVRAIPFHADVSVPLEAPHILWQK